MTSSKQQNAPNPRLNRDFEDFLLLKAKRRDRNCCTKLAHYGAKIDEVIEFFDFQSLGQHPPLTKLEHCISNFKGVYAIGAYVQIQNH